MGYAARVQVPRFAQPVGPVEIDVNNELTRNLQLATSADWFARVNKPTVKPSASSGISPGATPDGIGVQFSGASTAYARFDDGPLNLAAGGSTIEALVYSTTYPSLANICDLTVSAATTGAVDTGSDKIGLLCFSGGPPCDIYIWGNNASHERDTNVPFIANRKQHVFIVKAPGTGIGTVLRAYVNGALVYDGTSGSAGTATTGPYWYLGGRHSSGSASIAGAVVKSAYYNRALEQAEVIALTQRPWQVFKQPVARVFTFAAAAPGGFSAAWARPRSGVIGAH